MLTRGTVLWRPVWFNDTKTFQVQVPEVRTEPSPTREGQQMLRLVLQPDYMWEPTVTSCDMPGIVVFVDKELERFWTHLVIRGMSKAMRDEPRNERGGAVFAEAMDNAMPFDEYLKARREMAMAINEQKETTLEKCIGIAKRFPMHTGCRRLVFYPVHSSGNSDEYEYDHIDDPKQV